MSIFFHHSIYIFRLFFTILTPDIHYKFTVYIPI